MLKTTENIGSITNSKKTKSKVGSNSIVSNSVVSGSKVINQISFTKGKNQAKTTKSKILVKSKNRDFPPNFKNIEVGSGFFNPKTKLAFTQLRQAFVEAPIFQHFNLEYHI